MSRRFALVAVWAVFAAAAVGVGFGAAGLAGSPFTGPDAASPVDVQIAVPSAGTGGSPSGSTDAVKGFSTEGGYVQGRCRGDLVSVTASPSVGWEIDDMQSGQRQVARVKFEQSGDGDGEIEVAVGCSGRVPVFARVTDDHGGHGGGSGSDDSGTGDGPRSGGSESSGSTGGSDDGGSHG